MRPRELRPLEWIASSKSDLKGFPARVRQEIGYSLYHAQVGTKHRLAKPLRGLGTGVLEMISDHRGDTFRAVYTVRFRAAVYVLHAFQKKAKRGIATPKREMDVLRRRLKQAEAHYQANYVEGYTNAPNQRG